MMKYKLKLIITFSFLGLLIGCATLKPKGATKTGKKLFETFYLGENGMQYFIKPISISNDKEKLVVDFTLRENDDLGIVNFSVIGEEPIHSIDSFIIETSSQKVSVNNCKLLYKERKKEFFESRFSANIEKDKLKVIFKDSSWSILVNNLNPFKTKNSSKKIISALNEHIFVLLKD